MPTWISGAALVALAVSLLVDYGLVHLAQTLLKDHQQAEVEHRMEVRALLARSGVPIPVVAPGHEEAPAPRGRWVVDPEGLEAVFVPADEE